MQYYLKLRTLEKDDATDEVRKACKQAVDSMEKGGKLGLRRELQGLDEQRARIRREALKRLLLQGEQS